MMTEEMITGHDRSPNGTKELIRALIKEMDRLSKTCETTAESLVQARIEIATLKTKAQIGGFLAGLVPSVGMFLVQFFYKGKQ